MKKKINLFLLLMLFILSFCLETKNVFAQSLSHNCQNPAMYKLTPDEVNASNTDFYCWEIQYLKKYQNTRSINLNSYYSLFPGKFNSYQINILRENGITPEKAEYLLTEFMDEDEDFSNINFPLILNIAIFKAKYDFKYKTHYIFGRPLAFVSSLLVKKPLGVLSNIKISSVYRPIFPTLGIDCLNGLSSNAILFTQYPMALQPVGVIGRYFVNAFGEIVGDFKQTKLESITIESAYVQGDKFPFATLDRNTCPIRDLRTNFKQDLSCISCTMFEIAFNTVSRIGFILYDKLAGYALPLLWGLFLIWTLIMFYENAIKKQDSFAFVKTFFSKIIFLVIASAFLSVSIKDDNNLINYTVRPFTELMVEYNDFMLSSFNKDTQYICNYKTKDIKNNEVIFSKDVKQNIVCTLENTGRFNNINIMIGKYQVFQGWRMVSSFVFKRGITKIILGIIIIGIFFMFNLSVSFFFIESLFKIAIVVFLFPLFIMGYAFDKGKNFVKKGFDTFISAVFQIISLTVMCAVISLLMSYVSSLSVKNILDAVEANNSEQLVAQMILAFSLNTNQLLEIIYTGLVAFYLMKEALTIADAFANGGYGKTETLPSKIITFSTNTIKRVTKVGREEVDLQMNTKTLYDKISKDKLSWKQSRDSLLNRIHKNGDN